MTDWYGNSPLEMEIKKLPSTFGDAGLGSFSFAAAKSKDGGIVVSNVKINGYEQDIAPQTVKIGQEFKMPFGTIVLKKTAFFDKNYEDELSIAYVKPLAAAKACMAWLSVELADKFSTVINFSYTDPSAKRAEDVLNTLLEAYNEEWIRYTNKSTVNTAQFIDERLAVIERELGNVDSDIESFKSRNRIMDISSETERVAEESLKYSEQTFTANSHSPSPASSRSI